ncbi:hypothetical protein [Curtobacterium flaccumfaciens]|uniref:hypothetical protein n=1 Tax=Curtobacterium flaccumfaciens TaxID=2035 RepID=UPI003D9A40FE
MRSLLHAPRTRGRSIAAAALGALALVGSLLVATPAQAINDTGTGGVFVPASGRVLDTKVGTGGFSTPMEAGKYRTIKIAGTAGIPDDGTVGAVSLNATVSGSPDNGILYGRPDADTSRTTMLIYNDNAGEYVSNTAIVAVSAAGTIQVSTETAARLILDVQGYYTANTDGTAAGGFVPVAGKRIVDTRSGLGAPKALLAPGTSVDIQVTGANGVPDGASGAVVNLIPINSTASDGYLTPYATGATRPSNALHYAPSVNTSIQAQVQLSSSGKMTIYNGSSTISLVIDLQGYFTAAGTTGATFTPGVGRVFDSRASGSSILSKNETRAIPVAGQAGVPVTGSGITAVVLTLTAVHGGSDGRASVWAGGTTQPDTTSINFQTDEIRTNTVTVALGANGDINLNNVAAPTNYVIDIQGWYINLVRPTITCPYTNGSTDLTIPESDFQCDVSAPPSGGTGQELRVTADGDETSQVLKSSASGTNAKVTVPARGGDHQVDAEIVDSAGNVVAGSSLGFHLGGDWANEAMTVLPAQDAYASVGTWLAVESERDIFPEDTTQVYTISANPDGVSTPLAVSEPINGSYLVPSGILQDGHRFYWTATTTGTSAGAAATVRTPVHAFTATTAKINNRCAAALQGVAEASSLSRADYESTCQGDDSQDPGVVADADDLGVDFSDDTAATASLAVARSAGAIHSTYGTATGHAPAYNWKSVMRGKFYYDGTSAWSKKKHRGKVGYQRCDDDGSYGLGVAVGVKACGNYSPKGKDILYETVKVDYVFRGSPVSYTQSFHLTVTKSGKKTGGKGVGF